MIEPGRMCRLGRLLRESALKGHRFGWSLKVSAFRFIRRLVNQRIGEFQHTTVQLPIAIGQRLIECSITLNAPGAWYNLELHHVGEID